MPRVQVSLVPVILSSREGWNLIKRLKRSQPWIWRSVYTVEIALYSRRLMLNTWVQIQFGWITEMSMAWTHLQKTKLFFFFFGVKDHTRQRNFLVVAPERASGSGTPWPLGFHSEVWSIYLSISLAFVLHLK